DPGACLRAAHGAEQRLLVRDGRDALVLPQPVLELVVELLERPLADAADARADRVQGAHELALVLREGGLDEDDVHGSGFRRASPGMGGDSLTDSGGGAKGARAPRHEGSAPQLNPNRGPEMGPEPETSDVEAPPRPLAPPPLARRAARRR